jgi:hypothetical protein
MPTYFHGWRRKIGVLTLVMACVLIAGWIRSFLQEDVWVMIKGDATVGIIISNDGSLCWSQADDPAIPDVALRFEYVNFNPFPDPKGFDEKDIQWIWRFAGCGFGKRFNEIYASSLQCCEIAYMPIVIPLTLLSAWLLLSKPRVAKLPSKST